MIDFTLMNHQKTALWQSQFKPDLFLAWQVGTGKSCGVIQMLRARCAEKGRLCRTLILAPSVVLKNWQIEIDKFSKIDPSQVFVLEGSIAKRTAFVEKHVGYSAVFITNYEAMQDTKFVDALLRWNPEVLIADEVHTCKNYKSKRAKNVQKVAAVCQNRYLLTGTPVLNSGQDLWMQYQILDGHLGKGGTFPPNFFVFRSQYFMDANAAWASRPNHFPKFVPREGAYEAMLERISEKTLRVTKEECLDLPPLVTQELLVPLGKEQRMAYDEMKKHFITYVKTGIEGGKPHAVVARLAITKALRLQQIVSGFVKTDEGEILRFKDVPRIKALKEQLEVLCGTHKVIIWSCFKENYRMIAEVCEELGLKYVEVHGETTNQEKNEAVKAFETDDSVRVLIGNQASGGVGITLVAASYSIYYSRGFKLGDDIQSESRNHRKGSEKHEKITRINLVSPDTSDQVVAEALKNKQDISESILDFASKL